MKASTEEKNDNAQERTRYLGRWRGGMDGEMVCKKKLLFCF